MNHCKGDWPVSILTIVALSLGVACLFGASQAIWAAPAGGPAYQVLPTAPAVTSRPTQPIVTVPATPTASPTPTQSLAGGEEAVTSAPAQAAPPFVPPITFRTPVYGFSSAFTGEGGAAPSDGSTGVPPPERGQESRLQESFVKIFPIWCFWPIVGLILIVAGLDLRASSRRNVQ
jgi:hypothetical protein